MNKDTKEAAEKDVLEQAIEALKEETGVRIQVKQTQVTHQDGRFTDALLEVGPDGVEIHVETKLHAAHTNIGAMIDKVQRLPGNPMLVADYINPKMAERLKLERIQYIDTAGNAFINADPIYILITGKKQNKNGLAIPKNTNRAFEPKGLIVTYAFLTDPNTLNLPYREIAAKTGVAVGTVGWVINALKDGKYIHTEARTKQRRVTNYRKLLDRWVEAWPEKLKPKHQLGTFTTDNANWWNAIKIENFQGYWGGEIAGAFYTKHLKPQITTIYIPKKNQAKLIRTVQLVKADELFPQRENIPHLLTPFWTPETDVDQNNNTYNMMNDYNDDLRILAVPGMANPILTYADLVATGDTRNLETARILYEERIARPYR